MTTDQRDNLHSNQPKAFHFPQGLAGFSDAKDYGFIYEGRGDIICIQSLDRPEAAFLLTPWDQARLGDYPALPSDMAACIEAHADSEIMWMLVLNPFADKVWVTANLKAPIALNTHSRLGIQFIRADANLDIRYHWMRHPSAG